MQTFKKLLFLLSPQERNRGGLLLIMMLTMGVIDTIGVASILPFIAVLSDPSLIETNFILNQMFLALNDFGVYTKNQFLFILGVIVFTILIISLSFKALTTYAQVYFINMREYSIGKRLIEGYLRQPYSWFLSHHSAELGKNILSEVQTVIANGMRPLLELISKLIVTILIITLLIIVEPKITFIICLVFTTAYSLFYFFIHKYLEKIGKKRFRSNELRFTAVNEAFKAIKAVKVGSLEDVYVSLFSSSAYMLARSQAAAQVISQLPRFFLEGIAFGGIILMVLFIISQTGSLNNALPIISLFAFAGYRLMPALQQIYASFASIAFMDTALDKLYEDLNNFKSFNKNQDKNILPFSKTISLKDVYYNYPNSSQSALKNINLTIPVNSSVGFIGDTGSGKTTIIDIILGILELQKGTLEVDGKVITGDNLRSWQRSIGYVPQQIYLFDDTIAANIAFGIDQKDINQDWVEKACQLANLEEFINELPKKYNTIIGEGGIRLSGGQRQRIGIARALYNNPQLLILDEATSALDSVTETAVMEAIYKLSKNITMILIAHRLSTVKKCDKIFMFEKGELKAQGTYKELVEVNNQFKENAKNF